MVLGDDEIASGKGKLKNMATGEIKEVSLDGEELTKFFYDVQVEALNDSLDGFGLNL